MDSSTIIAFIIGFIIGMIVMLIIAWVLYATRAPPFGYCSGGIRCTGTDYYSDPGDALAANPSLTAANILIITADKNMLYDRVLKTANCIPEHDQVVEITYPQYCNMTTTDGTVVEYRDQAFNANLYKATMGTGATITTTGSCVPVSGSGFDDGAPVLKWDKNPLVK
jgi:hypothetical protein